MQSGELMIRLYIVGLAVLFVIGALWWFLGRKKSSEKPFTGNVESGNPTPTPRVRDATNFATGEGDADVCALIAAGKKIEAIKRVRQRTGLGLKEAKDYVERL